MKKHNYPSTRKPRDTSYSMTHKLIEYYGEHRLYEIWCENNGMYKAAEWLSKDFGYWVTPDVVRYLSYKFNWKRVITDLSLPVAQGIIQGTVDASYYKHIVVSGLVENL